MEKLLLILFLSIIHLLADAQERFSQKQWSVNLFRNPSIGLEYHHKRLSGHVGYYVTNFTSGITTEFLRTGITYWLIPFGKNEIPSSFYIGISYLRGLTRDYRTENAISFETGVRWIVWKGLNFRLGIIAIVNNDNRLKLNPTPGISYSFH